ncbi:MAG: hypothetical protein AAF202_05415, partial [Pseudomonadota bacterium]
GVQAIENDNFFGVEEMANGEIVLTSHSKSSGARDGFDDALVIRASSDLETVLWARSYGLSGQHDRIENAHNISENSRGQIIFSGFSTPNTQDDNSDSAFVFSLNADGSGLESCQLMKQEMVQLLSADYVATLNSQQVALPLNSYAQIQSLSTTEYIRVIDNEARLEKVCQ